MFILDYFRVWTPSIATECINTDFDHRLNELFFKFLENFSCLEFFRTFSSGSSLAFNKTCQMNNFLIKCQEFPLLQPIKERYVEPVTFLYL